MIATGLTLKAYSTIKKEVYIYIYTPHIYSWHTPHCPPLLPSHPHTHTWLFYTGIINLTSAGLSRQFPPLECAVRIKSCCSATHYELNQQWSARLSFLRPWNKLCGQKCACVRVLDQNTSTLLHSVLYTSLIFRQVFCDKIQTRPSLDNFKIKIFHVILTGFYERKRWFIWKSGVGEKYFCETMKTMTLFLLHYTDYSSACCFWDQN